MADLVDYALTTLLDVKESLGIAAGNTAKDNLLKRKINQATEMIEGYCGLAYNHHFVSDTFTTEEFDGSGGNQLILRMRPVTTLSSFQYRTTTVNESDWDDVESELYFLDSAAGVIDLLFTQTNNFNRYRVTYTAGYTTIPSDLSEACVTLAAYLAENSSSGTSVKRKQEGRREIEYFPSRTGESLIEQLSLDDTLARYIQYNVAPNV